MKNCDPLVPLPRFAIDKRNGLSCLTSNDSSAEKNVFLLCNKQQEKEHHERTNGLDVSEPSNVPP